MFDAGRLIVLQVPQDDHRSSPGHHGLLAIGSDRQTHDFSQVLDLLKFFTGLQVPKPGGAVLSPGDGPTSFQADGDGADGTLMSPESTQSARPLETL